MDVDMIVLECEEHMSKAVEYLKHELRGMRTGRASAAMIEHVKVDAYGSTTDLKNLAALSVPESNQILVKPFDPSTMTDIIKGIEKADLGLNPRSEGKQIRVPVPTLSGDRRKQLASQAKTAGEQAKVAIRSARRDANKHIDAAEKDKASGVSEDAAKGYKNDVQELTKKYEADIDSLVDHKTKEIMEV